LKKISASVGQDAKLLPSRAGNSRSLTSIWYVVPRNLNFYIILIHAAIPSDEKVSKRAVGTWDAAYTKASAALAKLSQSEKIGIVTGLGWQGGGCVGNTKAAGSIGYPSLCLQGKC
jgi:hypothetical protein